MYGRFNILLASRTRGRLFVALLSTFTASLLISGAPASTAATTGSISGRVTGPTGAELTSVTVDVFDATQADAYHPGWMAKVNADGTYTVSGVPAGTYKVRFDDNSYIDGSGQYQQSAYVGQWYSNRTSYNSAQVVTVADGQTVTGKDVALVHPGTIAGHVSGPTGADLTNVAVVALDATGNGVFPTLDGQVLSDGSYTIGNIPPGTYKLQAVPRLSAYVGQWYQNKPSFNTADGIQVSSDVSTTAAGMTLAKGATIAGTVTGPNGAEQASLSVRAQDSNGMDVQYAQVNPDGTYQLIGLPAGTYRLFFTDYGYTDAAGVRQQAYSGQWYSNKNSFSTADPISVGLGQTLNSINAALNPAATVTGHITGPSAAQMTGICVAAFPASAATPLIVKPSTTTNFKTESATAGPCLGAYAYLKAGAAVPVAQDGSYTLIGLPAGSYRVVALPATYWDNTGTQQPVPFVEQWFSGKILRSSATTVTGNAAQTTQGVDFTLRPDMSFGDVPAGTLFHDEITWLGSEGISTGWTEADGTHSYRPVTPVNRDAMAAFLYRLAGSPDFTAPAVSPFTDVATDNPFYRQITWLATTGISTGYPGPNNTRTFQPLSPVNRDAMAAFLYRFAGSPAYTAPASSPFTDVATNNQFYAQINWLADTKITTGWTAPDGTRTFQPISAVNRDAMAAFMSRYQNMDALKQ